MLSKSVCPLNGEPPSTSSPTYQFGLNPVEMSKSRREQKALTHRDPLCSRGPRRRFGVRRGSLSLQARVKQTHTGSSVSLTQTHTKMPCWHSFVVRNLRRLSLYLYLYEKQALLLGLSSYSSSSFSTLSQHIHLMCFPAVNLLVVSVESHIISTRGIFISPRRKLPTPLSLGFFGIQISVCTRALKIHFLALSRCCNGLDLMQSLRTLLQPTPQIAAGSS